MFQPISLFSVIFFGLMNLPAYAQNATVLNAEQTATVSGSNNQVYQVINQTVINHPGQGWINRDKDKDKQKNDRSAHARDNRNDNRDDDN